MKKILFLFLIILLLVPIIKYQENSLFDFTLNSLNINKQNYVENLQKTKFEDSFAEADRLLILGRLTNNSSLICSSIKYYEKINSSLEEKALALETIYTLPCKRDKDYLLESSEIWKKLNNNFRAEINYNLSKGLPIDLKFETSNIKPKLMEKNTLPTIGSTTIILDKNDIITTQTDRVTRDWLSYQLQNPFNSNILTIFSEKLTYSKEELREDIGWHEGRILKQFNLTNKIATGTLVAKKNNKWYAPNEFGIFMFEIPRDKLLYPTTRFLKDDLAIIIDTHGINTVVEQAIRYNSTTVLACCDHPGKVKASIYLANKGIKVICPTDKYLYLALGHNLPIIGSPPIKIEDNIVLGNKPLKLNQKIIVVNSTNNPHALWYYQTPTNYFNELSKYYPLDIEYITLTDFNQQNEVIEKAQEKNINIIATRIFNFNDYKEIKGWLEQNKNHKVILFHSVSYPYGYLIQKEFPNQISFGDINPT